MSGDAQNQSQWQSVTVNVAAAGDPALEARILNEVYSTGRQLGRLSDVLALLIAARSDAAVVDGAAGRGVLNDFFAMRDEIEKAKAEREPEHFTDQLEQLRATNREAFGRVHERLGAWLAANPR